ncbi:FecR domain-containing protein [Bordetella sp. N]|uniref:FecR domain-containing protein n=1 Tax=Bordetella sp. N TaxID=1746199 RepID=UPI00070F639B|nr:FecR family protein [Bordetella sp. N]ALM85788.1 iron dicitrate transport regulator FecR [Bordetella sp. N]
MSAYPPAALLEEAAEWVMRLRFDTPQSHDREAFAAWLARSAAHAQAWARAEKVLGTFDTLPAGIGSQVLRPAAKGVNRRAVLRAGAGLALGLPLAWLAWRERPWQVWLADAATGIGERRRETLPDGTQLVLNTASAVDIAYSASERRVILRKGEILVTTGADADAPAYRPFFVDTPAGTVQALGTRFGVRCQEDGAVDVTVFEHAVLVQPAHGAALRLEAGQQTRFDAAGARTPRAAEEGADLWTQGMLLARDMRLADVLAELGRYRPGFLRCDPAIANMRVSGAVSVADTDAALAALAQTFSLRIQRISRYWVSVGPA